MSVSGAPETKKPNNKLALSLVIAGAVLLPLMGCGGLLVLGVVGAAMSGATPENAGPPMVRGGYTPQPGMPGGMNPQPGIPGGMAPMPGSPGMMPGGGSGGEVPQNNGMDSTPGVRGFNEYINDQSTIQDNGTGEVQHGVDNNVVQPLVDSGSASVVSSDTPATTE
jgi:hypothetical protein